MARTLAVLIPLLIGAAQALPLQWKDLTIHATAEQVTVKRSGNLLWTFQGNMITPESVRVVQDVLIIDGMEGSWADMAKQQRPAGVHAFDPYTGRKLAQARGILLEGTKLPIGNRNLYFLDFDAQSKPVNVSFTDTHLIFLNTATRKAER